MKSIQELIYDIWECIDLPSKSLKVRGSGGGGGGDYPAEADDLPYSLSINGNNLRLVDRNGSVLGQVECVTRAEYMALLNRVVALETKLNQYSDVQLQLSDGSSTTTTKFILGRD